MVEDQNKLNILDNKKISNCILHIGMNKTGSTSIQEYLQNNDLGPDFYYVKLGSSNHSSYITSLFSKNPERKHNYVKRGLSNEEIKTINMNLQDKLLKEFNKKLATNYIISGEEILHLTFEELSSLRAFMEKYFSQITVVGYVREPWSFIESLYQQCLKGGLINDFNIESMYPRYRQKFEKFYKIFGDSNVDLWQYNPPTFPNNNIVNDFCNNLGINYKFTKIKRLNESLSADATSLLFVNRQFFSYGKGPYSIIENDNIIKKLGEIGSSKFELDHTVILPILYNNKKDIAWMENKLNEKLIIKKSFSRNAIKSAEDFHLLAKRVINDLLEVTNNKLKNKKIDSLYEIAQIIEDLKVDKKELCIIHIGMPKTGSTAIQIALNKYDLGSDISYVKLSEVNHSVPIFSLFSKREESHNQHKTMGMTEVEITEYKQKNREMLIDDFLHGKLTQIISGEDIFHLTLVELEGLKSFIERYFNNILIVGYVRAPISFMSSAFQELVKMNILHKNIFSIIYPFYRQKLEKFDRVFGRENVKLFEFKIANFHKNDIVSDFCFNLNISIEEYEPHRTNESIPKEAVSLLYVYAMLGTKVNVGKDNVQLNNRLTTELCKIGHSRFGFSKNFCENILEYDDIVWIEERMNIKFIEEIQGSDNLINYEEDLLKFTDETIGELKELIGIKYLPKESLKMRPEDVAKLVGALKIKLANDMGFKLVDTVTEKKEISPQEENRQYITLKGFDIDWSEYHKTNKVDDVSIDPITHYINNWRKTDLIIKNVFSTFYYLSTYQDVKEQNLNPLIHFFNKGEKEGRKGIPNR